MVTGKNARSKWISAPRQSVLIAGCIAATCMLGACDDAIETAREAQAHANQAARLAASAGQPHPKDALYQRVARNPDSDIAYPALAAYRFLPLLQTEFETIRLAHRLRGVGRTRGPLGWLREQSRLAIPLLANAMRIPFRKAGKRF